MIRMRDILKKILIAIFAIFIVMPGFAEEPGDIGPYGEYTTEHNRTLITTKITEELSKFGPTETTVDNAYVPVEAKLGLAFMGGMAKVGVALDSSLVRFTILFILIAYAFWVALEAYNLIESGADAKKTVQDILLKGILISAWIIVLNFGIVKTFSMVVMPIISFGTFISTAIWQGIISTAGYAIPNTCAAIRDYANTNISPSLATDPNVTANTLIGLKMSAESAAELLCIPTQMSGFFVTVIGIGWKWVLAGVGVSLFTSLFGILITYLGLKCIYKFLFIALGVIADLFLSLLLLPFTAVAETIAKTNYKGVAGDIFNTFLGIFVPEKLEKQINRFVGASVYFICLSVAVGVSLALLAFVVDPMTGQFRSGAGGIDGAILLVLCLLLVCYMADKAESLASKWGGEIDSGLGDKLQKEFETYWNLSKEKIKKIRSLLKKD